MLHVLSQSEVDLVACFEQDIRALVGSFSEKDTSGKQSLQQILSSDQAVFGLAAIRALGTCPTSAGTRYLLHLLRKHNLLLEALLDPWGSKREHAVAAARMIADSGAPLDKDLEGVLNTILSQPPTTANSARILRVIDILEAASAQPRFYLFQTELMGHPDAAVRARSSLLLARSGKNTALVGRLMLDADPRVQANAVEALWTFDAEDARPLLMSAARSAMPRVAGNAAVGLYRVGDLAGIRLLFNMAQESDPARRTSAAWAMGETGDPRFLPFLTAWFTRSAGNERVHILTALGRIRRREKSLAPIGTIEIRIWSAVASGPERRLTLSLWSAEKPDLGLLKPTEFVIHEAESLIQDFEISAQPNPALTISGFVLPRFSSATDSYQVAALEAMGRCLKYKRADDLWRIDRYLTDPRSGNELQPTDHAALPYDESTLGSFVKAHQRGFLSAPEALQKIVESPGSRIRAADDAVSAFERQSDAMIKFSGKRMLFLFLPRDFAGRPERHIARLMSFVDSERLTLHGIAPSDGTGCDMFQALCVASDGGTFAMLPPEEIPGAVERIYAQSVNRFEVNYRVPAHSASTAGTVQITSVSGCGRGSFSLEYCQKKVSENSEQM